MNFPDTVTGRRTGRARRFRWLRPAALTAVILLVAIVVLMRVVAGGADAPRGIEARRPSPSSDSPLHRVEVVNPRKGGIERVTTQPGSVHSFETVELHAMVSGYLRSQSVDIGTRVKKGDVLAEIDVPREIRVAEEAEAMVEQARARARQMEAKVKAMEAERDTVAASAEQIESDLDRLVAESKLAEGQYIRVKSLYERHAIAKKLVDEQQRDREATIAAERTGRLAILTAKARLTGALARVDQARADVAEARAAIGVAEAREAKARVDLDYAKIIAPFDGVVTHRGYHPGAFVRAASDGTQAPMLKISRTDKMRVVVKVPDRDVVLTDPGDPATVAIDGLGGREFRGAVSRIGESEDSESRTMRVEIDLPNPDGLLRDGMYGRAKILLEPPSGRLTLPAACVLDRSGTGRGVLDVVRDGHVERVAVQLGADDGTLVEIVEGLGPDDLVVRRTSKTLEPGMRVITELAE